MKAKYTLVFLFILIHTVSFSQGEFIVEIYRTGTFNKIGPGIAGITWIFPNDRAIDENTGTFIFSSSLIEHWLYSINTSDGSIIYNPLINNILAFQFDNSNNILYGIEQDNANNVKYFISINPITGATTRIGNALPSSAMYGGHFSTFDEINHTYTFLAPPYVLYSIDAASGDVISSPNLSLASGESVGNFTYDNSTPAGILYGLLQDSNLGLYFLITIDPTTGAITRKGSGTSFGSGNAGSGTIDELNQQYMYMYSSQTAGGYAITTLDMATGNLDYNALIQPFTNNDNFFSLTYDQTQGRLFSIHWETITVGVELTAEKPSSFFLGQNYPNPFNPTTTIKYSLPESGFVNIAVYDLLGREVAVLVSKEQSVGKYEINFDASDLVSGVYIYRTRVNDFVDSKKMILLR